MLGPWLSSSGLPCPPGPRVFLQVSSRDFSLRFLYGLGIFPCETTDGVLQIEGLSREHRKEFCKQMASISKHRDGFLLAGHHPRNWQEVGRRPSRALWNFLQGCAYHHTGDWSTGLGTGTVGSSPNHRVPCDLGEVGPGGPHLCQHTARFRAIPSISAGMGQHVELPLPKPSYVPNIRGGNLHTQFNLHSSFET